MNDLAKARFGLFRYDSGFDRVAPTFPRLVGRALNGSKDFNVTAFAQNLDGDV
jgi:hypothetical protein